MKKVYSIWICMDCPEDKKDSIINYSFEPHIIYQGNDKLKLYKNCDLMNITFIHLSGKPDQSHHQLISMLDILLASMDAETKKKKLQEEQAAASNLRLVYLHKIILKKLYSTSAYISCLTICKSSSVFSCKSFLSPATSTFNLITGSVLDFLRLNRHLGYATDKPSV